ncbi:hypothetical protein NC99_14030 [Sunxiuqinia dokdonensis]|uniref:Uncharacterized protein n=1 Tax=Sunxiuqinia dokdonensis TaxID=1409788 RepID=A0A0L8VBE2_9BACT|nr:hypothetical protein NC99_14030 [Sunxiuqinia dokdonensis]
MVQDLRACGWMLDARSWINLKPETRNPKPKTRNLKLGI